MNYHALFRSSVPIRAALIGTGAFGNSFLYQTRAIPRLEVAGVCDLDMAAARRACLHAGWPEEALAYCSTEAEAHAAVRAGRVALVEDARLLFSLPVEVVVEATGMPEAGAAHAQAALNSGKHVVMVTKETDCVAGPILSRMAAERGLVYSQADGDQPNMLIGLISWAETLGLEVICAGKASESDIVYDMTAKTLRNSRATVDLAEDDVWPLWEMPAGEARETVERRREELRDLCLPVVADLCEMAIVMNATGYGYDAPALHAPPARITELADVWAEEAGGGLLRSTGVIDVVNSLRRSDEASFAGGVFVVVACGDEASWRLLRDKGHVVSRDLARAAVYLPFHLLGVQTATTILSAVDLGIATGGMDVRPCVDVGIVATEPLPAGRRLTMSSGHVIPGTRPELMPSLALAAGSPVPYYMAAENTLTCDVPAGAVLTCDMVSPDSAPALWALRRRQDEVFQG